ncbi:hypothetical protein B5X24_HaOG210560 [Helicoverpa armigera]|uniref:Major facilitator superfamily (MFS) profile domain-containing protein n=1 Tax=Helicoverpa armigera TaxID=29058 RepID=A0A2W1BGI1_HELAM|nr:hypothetical protein B5X24_HaOG210560 [Helicoverpa armigera]
MSSGCEGQRSRFVAMIIQAVILSFEHLWQSLRVVRSQRALAIPPSNNGPYSHDRCKMYSTDFAQALAEGRTTPDDEWAVVPCQFGWEYNRSDVPYDTIASELDWVCEKDNLAATAQAIFFCGAIVGGLVFGWIADKYGRIPALVGTNLLGFIAGVGTSFCDSFLTFALCRFFVGLAFDNCFTMMYILVLEYVGPKWRTFVANMSIALFFTLAASLLPWIALWADDWRMFALGTSLPFALAILTPWMVPESARWLVSQGKIDKALTIMKKFERINKTKIPEKVLSDFTESSLKTIKESEAECRTYSVLDLFKTPRLRRNAILLIIIWMAISLVFDGHVRNVGSLGLDIFLTFTIASATELPADTFLTAVLDRWGRRWLACGSMVISGIFSLLATAVPAGGPSASLAIMGRFAVNISYNIGLQYAAELLPTVVRAQGVALIHIMGYVASIVAPFVVYLANISQDLPLLILGVLGVAGGLAILTPWMVPESARWLVSQGKIDKALTIMKKFERINKTKIPEKVLSDFTESSLKTIKESEAECRTYSVLDLFKTPRLRRNAILLIIIWMAISLVFDGHVRNVGSLGLDIFLTFTIASATELPADTFLTAVLDRWGRRWLACGSMVISGIFSLLATAVPAGGPSASLAIMGRFAVNISYNIGLQYAAELLPTVVRAQGVALIHIMGYVASIVAPFVVYLANISQDLPLLILGVLGVAGGLLCLFLPETMDTEMPQTLQDGENFGKDQRFWDNPCFPRKKAESDEEHPGKYTKRPSVSTNEPQEFVRAVPSAIGSRASIRASIRASTRASARRREVNKDRNIV